MQFGPRFHKPLLSSWKRTRDHLNGIDTEDSYLILPVRMKMRNMMLSPGFDEHADNNSEEPAKLWHVFL